MEGVINCSLNTHDTEIPINRSPNTHDTEIPINRSPNTHDTEIPINCSLNTHDTEIPINRSPNTHDTEIPINGSPNTHDTEIPVQMVDLARFKIDESPPNWGIPMGTSPFIYKLYAMLAQSITDPRTREVLSWKEDDLSFEIKDYQGFHLLMEALFFKHKKWPASFCHYGIKCKFNHPSLQRGQPNRLSQFNMITDEVPARVRERDPPTEKRRWTI